MSLPVENKSYDASEACFPQVLFRSYPHGTHERGFHLFSGKFIQQLVHIPVEVLAVTGISCRMDAGSASECIHFETRIVGKTIVMAMLPYIVRLLLRIGPQSVAGLGNILKDSHLCRGNELESLA